LADFPLGAPILGESAQKSFVKAFSAILRVRNILSSFDDFSGDELLSGRQVQDYQSIYLNIYSDTRAASEADKESIVEDLVFEIELIKQVEVNVDYILSLVQKYLAARGTGKDKELKAAIDRTVEANPGLRNKRELIDKFINSISVGADIPEAWSVFVRLKKTEELEQLISDERLNPEETRQYVERAFNDGFLSLSGTAITKIMPPVSRFSKSNEHSVKKQAIIVKLTAYFERYYGMA
jgi:type I restriction enzyme R subunit